MDLVPLTRVHWFSCKELVSVASHEARVGLGVRFACLKALPDSMIKGGEAVASCRTLIVIL